MTLTAELKMRACYWHARPLRPIAWHLLAANLVRDALVDGVTVTGLTRHVAFVGAAGGVDGPTYCEVAEADADLVVLRVTAHG